MLKAKGIEYECVNINLKDKPEWFLEMNPLGKVPVIEMPDGKVLYESAICCGELKKVTNRSTVLLVLNCSNHAV